MDNALARLSLALAEWTSALGREFVTCDQAALAQCATATFATSQKVFAVLHPANTSEVSRCLAIANAHRVPMYPISRGRNWGLGSRVPVQDAVVLDLGRMQEIANVEERFGTITLQPGVTFQQAHEHLKRASSAWFLPVIGGPADASVIGNCLERGDVTGPQKDRLASILSLEVVMSAGEVISTGYERFGASALAALSNTPAGPGLHGLFTQSNLGVVTRATLALAPLPKTFQIVQAEIASQKLAAFVDALQPLAMHLGENATFSIWNGHKFNARQRDASQHLPPDAWRCNCALYAGSARMGEAQREMLVDALSAASQQLHTLDESNVPNLREMAGLFLGEPNNDNVASLYTHKESFDKDDMHPDRDRCGALWLCPEAPFDGATLMQLVNICERTSARYSFEPVLGIFVNTHRSLRIFVSLFYDRDVEGEDTRAMQCHDEMQQAFLDAGFPPFRLGLPSMPLTHRSEEEWRVLQKLKRAIDPNNILAPGRYLANSERT